MRKTNGNSLPYAIDVEIIAASDLFEIDMFVQTEINHSIDWSRYSSSSDCDQSKMFITIQHQNEHFSSSGNSKICLSVSADFNTKNLHRNGLFMFLIRLL